MLNGRVVGGSVAACFQIVQHRVSLKGKVAFSVHLVMAREILTIGIAGQKFGLKSLGQKFGLNWSLPG